MGPDRLPVQVLKYGGSIIIEAINDIMRDSIESGEIPECLKVGWITPIWKGDDMGDPLNYRPISLTSHVSKIMERVIRQEMTHFLTSNNLTEESQYGSRSGRGTMSQLLKQHYMIIFQ